MTAAPGTAGAPAHRPAVGCDGSGGGLDAVALARRLAAAEASFLLLDVAPHPGLAGRLRDHSPADFSAARHLLASGSTRPPEIETRTVHAESPAEVLADVAGDERRDLLVVGSPHRGLLGRSLLGSVAKSLLRRSPIPVAIAPHGFSGSRGKAPDRGRIVVGADGSPEAEAALAWAESLAAARGAVLEVFTIATPPTAVPGALGRRSPGPGDPFAPLGEVADRVREDVEVHAHVLVGQAAPSLAAAAADADLLVVGAQAHRPLEEALVGSVADALATSPTCPLVAVPLRGEPWPERRSHPDGEGPAATEDEAA